MPTRNTIKVYIPGYYYHVYNRGWNKTEIFKEEADYAQLEALIARCLAPETAKDSRGREYVWLGNRLALNAYCLMPNHFHMLIYQESEDAMQRFIQSICTAYTMFFNKKYKRRGPLFENRFKAVPIHRDDQLQHVSRYIHLNHWNFRSWQHSSYHDYLGGRARNWIKPSPILELFDSRNQYMQFVLDYEAAQRDSEKLKKELADSE